MSLYLVQTSTALNPIVFLITDPLFKDAARSLFRKRRRSSREGFGLDDADQEFASRTNATTRTNDAIRGLEDKIKMCC